MRSTLDALSSALVDEDARAGRQRAALDAGLDRVRTQVSTELAGVRRDLAAQRWYDGDGGPGSPIAQAAPLSCDTCGFLVRVNGTLGELFGVCGNGDANDDGRAVSLDHGCGAHSEIMLAKKHEPVPVPDPVFDTLTPGEVETF